MLSCLSAAPILTKHRPLNIPSGRVAQVLKALQDTPPDPTIHRTSTSKTRKASTINETSAKQDISPEDKRKPPQNENVTTSVEDSQRTTHPTELSAVKASPRHDRDSTSQSEASEQLGFRGRPSARQSFTRAQNPDNLDEALEDIRSKLHSVQKIIRRERSGSSEARDEMLDDLGTMLDSAIATTLTPLNTPMLGARPPSRVRGASSSPAKQPRSSSQLARSQSVKQIDPLHLRLSSRPALSGDATPSALRIELPTRAQTPDVSKMSTLAYPIHQLEQQRDRQVSAPVNKFARPFGFPLTSPVRERTLL